MFVWRTLHYTLKQTCTSNRIKDMMNLVHFKCLGMSIKQNNVCVITIMIIQSYSNYILLQFWWSNYWVKRVYSSLLKHTELIRFLWCKGSDRLVNATLKYTQTFMYLCLDLSLSSLQSTFAFLNAIIHVFWSVILWLLWCFLRLESFSLHCSCTFSFGWTIKKLYLVSISFVFLQCW